MSWELAEAVSGKCAVLDEILGAVTLCSFWCNVSRNAIARLVARNIAQCNCLFHSVTFNSFTPDSAKCKIDTFSKLQTG